MANAYGYQNSFDDSLAQEFRKVLSVPSEITLLDGSFFSDVINFTRTSSATYFDADGILQTATPDIPRIDYLPDGNGLCGLMIEGARTNKFIQATDLSTWAKAGNNTLNINAITSPDGTTNAAHLVADNTAGTHWLGAASSPAIAAGATCSISIFMKRNGLGINNRYFHFSIRNSDWSGRVGFQVDLDNGTIHKYEGGTGTVQSVRTENIGNGWYRCIANKCYIDASSTSAIVEGYFLSALGGSGVTTGDGINGVGLYGGQFEEDDFATSFIPTTTTAVTRAADICTINNIEASDWFNPVEGSFYADYQKIGAASTAYGVIVQVDNGSNDTNRIAIHTKPDNDSNAVCIVRTDGVTEYSFEGAVSGDNAPVKAALPYKENDTASAVNGITPATDTSVILPTVTLNTLRIGLTAAFPQQFFGHIFGLKYYSTRLKNEILGELTT